MIKFFICIYIGLLYSDTDKYCYVSLFNFEKYRFGIQFLLVFFPKFNNVYLPDKGDYHPHKLSDKRWYDFY